MRVCSNYRKTDIGVVWDWVWQYCCCHIARIPVGMYSPAQLENEVSLRFRRPRYCDYWNIVTTKLQELMRKLCIVYILILLSLYNFI
jgi:hypothetical protein